MTIQIKGIEGMSGPELMAAVNEGGRFVHYQYAFSIIIMTFRQPTDIYFVRATDSSLVKGLPFTLLTFVLGWWGIPWGPIYTVQSLWRNLSGGTDVTAEVLDSLMQPADPQPAERLPGDALG